MSMIQVKYPLRPTLLVIAGAQPYEQKSLAERLARQYAEAKKRLTEKFSDKNWDIAVVDCSDEDAIAKGWDSLEHKKMLILTGYQEDQKNDRIIDLLRSAANPVVTLVVLGDDNNPVLQRNELFEKAVTLLMPAGLEEQALITHCVLKQTRDENAYERDPHQPQDHRNQTRTGQIH